MLTPSLPLLTPQLHTGPDAEADVLTECLALQQLHTSTQLAASDGKGGRALGQELLPGRQAGRQGRGGALSAASPAGRWLCSMGSRGHVGMTCWRHPLLGPSLPCSSSPQAYVPSYPLLCDSPLPVG